MKNQKFPEHPLFNILKKTLSYLVQLAMVNIGIEIGRIFKKLTLLDNSSSTIHDDWMAINISKTAHMFGFRIEVSKK